MVAEGSNPDEPALELLAGRPADRTEVDMRSIIHIRKNQAHLSIQL
jgi:hypothetical protein